MLILNVSSVPLLFFGTEADMKHEMERKEKERKKSPKIDFVHGGTQPIAAAAVKISTQVPGTDFPLLCND